VGLADAQGLLLAESFYWDRTEESRQWSKRFFARRGVMPTQMQAAVYSAVTHYLKAVALGASQTRQAAGILEHLVETGPLVRPLCAADARGP
jgi:branched-chain amino acid transport system substrate-binding protein